MDHPLGFDMFSAIANLFFSASFRVIFWSKNSNKVSESVLLVRRSLCEQYFGHATRFVAILGIFSDQGGQKKGPKMAIFGISGTWPILDKIQLILFIFGIFKSFFGQKNSNQVSEIVLLFRRSMFEQYFWHKTRFPAILGILRLKGGQKWPKQAQKWNFWAHFWPPKSSKKAKKIVSYVQNIAQTDSDELVKHFLILCLSFFDQKMTQNQSLKKLLLIFGKLSWTAP